MNPFLLLENRKYQALPYLPHYLVCYQNFSIDETTQRDISEYMANMSMASNTDSNDDEIEPEVHALKDVTNTINGVGTSPEGREYVTVARGRYRCTPATHNHIESDIEVDEVRHYTSSEKMYSLSTYLPMIDNDSKSFSYVSPFSDFHLFLYS